jgi:diguanylate cyclase (GGDEF)-like protein/PAS domain S-box-containing protein
MGEINRRSDPAYSPAAGTATSAAERGTRYAAPAQDPYRRLVEDSPIAIVVQVRGKVAYANHAAARLVCVDDRTRLLGRELLTMLPPDEHARARDWTAGFLAAGGGAGTSRWSMLRDSGAQCTIEVTAVGVDFLGQDAVHMEMRDVSEQTAVEAGLRESQERFHSVFLRSPLPMAVMEPDGRFGAVNPALCALLGRREQDLLGRRLQDIRHPDEAALGGGGVVPGTGQDPHRTEQCYEHRSGGVIWAVLTLTELWPGREGHYTLAQIEDVTAGKEAEHRRRHQAHHDLLTGLPNRAGVATRLAALSRTSLADLSVLFVGLDGFKLVNDARGHDIGDAVLVEVARRLRTVVRPQDLVARFSGDEFVVVCPGLPTTEESVAVALLIGTAVSAPVAIPGDVVTVTASVGIAHATSALPDATDLLRHANLAMDRAKRSGWGRVQVSDEQLHADAESRACTETALRHAVEDERLTVHYQPIVDLDTGRIVAVESLARLTDCEGRLLPSDQFIAVAEETGLIVPIGGWVLRQACRQAAAWRAETGRQLSLSVNLSPHQVARPDLLDTVLEALEVSGLEHGALFLELTESALIEANDSALTQLTALRDLGVGIGIDDFGTGYSSLRYLRQFPATFLKLDRGFVAGITDVPADAAIVAAVAGLARDLSLGCVAEGVETPEQLDALRAMGVRLGQGFLFGRPMPAGDLTDLLRSDRPLF